MGKLLRDKSGNLFGATYNGGPSNYGTVFELAADGTEKVLYVFMERGDGGLPYAGVIEDRAGNLYGTTSFSGGSILGNVYKLAPGGTESVLYSFCAKANCADGSTPEAPLIFGSKGNLYGTTYSGGAYNGNGTVFRVAPDGKESVLHSFGSQSGDGYGPVAGLIEVNGYLYGTTLAGGAYNEGTVFKVQK